MLDVCCVKLVVVAFFGVRFFVVCTLCWWNFRQCNFLYTVFLLEPKKGHFLINLPKIQKFGTGHFMRSFRKIHKVLKVRHVGFLVVVGQENRNPEFRIACCCFSYLSRGIEVTAEFQSLFSVIVEKQVQVSRVWFIQVGLLFQLSHRTARLFPIGLNWKIWITVVDLCMLELFIPSL